MVFSFILCTNFSFHIVTQYYCPNHIIQNVFQLSFRICLALNFLFVACVFQFPGPITDNRACRTAPTGYHRMGIVSGALKCQLGEAT